LIEAEEGETVPSAEDDIKPVVRQETAKVSARSSQQKMLQEKENVLSEAVDKFFNNVDNEVSARTGQKKNKSKVDKENSNSASSKENEMSSAAPNSESKLVE